MDQRSEMMRDKHDFYRETVTPPRCPTSSLRCPQRARFLSTLILTSPTTKIQVRSITRDCSKERVIQTSCGLPQDLETHKQRLAVYELGAPREMNPQELVLAPKLERERSKNNSWNRVWDLKTYFTPKRLPIDRRRKTWGTRSNLKRFESMESSRHKV
jgi:hypothetical protein